MLKEELGTDDGEPDVRGALPYLARAAGYGSVRALNFIAHALYDAESWIGSYARQRKLENKHYYLELGMKWHPWKDTFKWRWDDPPDINDYDLLYFARPKQRYDSGIFRRKNKDNILLFWTWTVFKSLSPSSPIVIQLYSY
jgi:hypothetical protein